MDSFLLGFTRCPNCAKYSINNLPNFGFPDDKTINWECPYCFLILEGDEWKKNIVQELKDEIEKNQTNTFFGKILMYSKEEISPKKAKDIAIDYLNKLNIKKFPPILGSAKISDYNEEWQVDFKKAISGGAIIIPDSYCIIVNKKTGQPTEISLE